MISAFLNSFMLLWCFLKSTAIELERKQRNVLETTDIDRDKYILMTMSSLNWELYLRVGLVDPGVESRFVMNVSIRLCAHPPQNGCYLHSVKCKETESALKIPNS